MKNDTIDSLYHRLRAREPVRNQLIEAVLKSKLVEARLASFLKRRPTFEYLSDDLYCDALLKLVQLCDELHTKELAKSVRGYLGEAITNHLKGCISQAATIHAPESTRHDRKKKGKPLELAQTSYLDDCDPWKDNRNDRDGYDRRYFEELDLILSCAEDDRDTELIRLLEQGYNGSEAAHQLGISEAQVSRRLTGIEARYDKKRKRLLCG